MKKETKKLSGEEAVRRAVEIVKKTVEKNKKKKINNFSAKKR